MRTRWSTSREVFWTTRTAPSSKKTISWTSSRRCSRKCAAATRTPREPRRSPSGTGSRAIPRHRPPPRPPRPKSARPSRWAAAPSAPWRRTGGGGGCCGARRAGSCTTTTSEGRRARPPRRKPRGPRRDALLAETAAAEAAELASGGGGERTGGAHAHRRRATGSRLAATELGPFQLPNPGGADLLDDAVLSARTGAQVRLIGRNGKGKSTLLKFIASARGRPRRRCQRALRDAGGALDGRAGGRLPGGGGASGGRRRTLIADVAEMEAREARRRWRRRAPRGTYPREAEKRRKSSPPRTSVSWRWTPARRRGASALLRNLGFSDALASRKMRALSGGWRVRVALAAALFASRTCCSWTSPQPPLRGRRAVAGARAA